MTPRRRTRQVTVGAVRIGGGAPVALQTMTAGYTHEIDKCIAEVQKLARAGADLVRVAVPEKKDTEALPHGLAALFEASAAGRIHRSTGARRVRGARRGVARASSRRASSGPFAHGCV